MATVELYSKGVSLWVPDPETVWASAHLLRDYAPGDKQLLLRRSDGKEVLYPMSSPADLPPLGNPEVLEGGNDLTALSFLHEPAVLHNLRLRFLDYSSIYTYCGIVLLAINPYEQLHIYGPEVMDAYSGQDTADLEPHIFSVAEEAYRTMSREAKNQSIVISGESGSGKTVSAKFSMRYFAVVGGAAQQTSVEERVLASNPIMESFGNAKTTQNDNSSRFGKYIEIGFGTEGNMVGAKMRTYLLEKTRVIFQATSERNYHIFYQLCSSRHLPEMKALKLDAPENFRYTNHGGEMEIPGVDDASDLERTRHAFMILGVQADQQMELFRILSAVLHLGNVQASGRRTSDKSFINADDRSLATFSKLLGVEGGQVAHWLCHGRLAVGGEMVVRPRTGQQATEARDALAKHIYGQMFSWIVQRLNSGLRGGQRGHRDSFIGVLDIYGFETFEQNSFEQFCINYANEKLQQQFNRHVFHLEQEEYVREELPWTTIHFSDNQECINLLEGQLGLLDLLDEECRMPKGSDENWVQKLYDQHLGSNPHPHFQKPRISNSAFIILHFADMVQYECKGFLDKNRDTVFEELVNIMKASQSDLVAELFQQQQQNTSPVANGSVRSGRRSLREHRRSVSLQFRQSLQALMDTLNSTTPHYVRCIKPNDLKRPFMFDPKRTVQQLRACGVLETIRISAAGFPSRWTYEEFCSRYHVLLRGPQAQEPVRASCRRVLPQLVPDPDQYRFGKTKVFLRAGRVAHLERLRAERLRGAAVLIQSRVRGWTTRLTYARLRRAAVTVQRYARGARARRWARTLRLTKAALVIQKTYRMLAVRQPFLEIRRAAVTIQAFTRGTLARREHTRLVAERCAVRLQAAVRGWLALRWYRRVRAAALFMQSCARRRAARRELLRLKSEARSVERYRELNKGMEVKLMQLQLRVDQEAREAGALREALHAERAAGAAQLEALRASLHKLETQKKERPPACSELSQQEAERTRRVQDKAEQDLLLLTQELENLQRETDDVKKDREEVTARLHRQEQEQEECIHKTVSQVTASLRAELDEERRKYQVLLRDFSRLEQRYDNLREMSLLTESTGGLRRTDSAHSLEPLSPSATPLSPLHSPFPVAPPLSPLSPLPSPLSLSPFPSAAPSPEEERRVVGSPPRRERRFSVWSADTPMERLMEKVGVAKDAAVKLNGEDLAHAYDAVRVANKFLESELRSQRSQWEAELEALRRQLPKTTTAAQPQELQEEREQECVRLRREVQELRSSGSLRRLLREVLPSALTSETPSAPSQTKASALSGLLECRKKDEAKLMKNLITDVQTDCALSLPPALPATIVFLCVRQADSRGEQAQARSLCGAALAAMKAALKKHNDSVDMTALWLKNARVLHDLLSQHSATQTLDSSELVPLATDLSDPTRALGALSIQAYQQLLSITETRLQSIIVPALLEYENIPGVTGSDASRKRAGSDPRAAAGPPATMKSVRRELGALHGAMIHQELDRTLLDQAFHQLTHLICASALNNLLLRRDMCCCSRGLHIRFNVSLLEDWLRSHNLHAGGAVALLEPLIQAVQLLQTGKTTEADARAIVQTCTALSSPQIVKILTLFTPQGDLEERVTLNFIRIVQGLLKGRSDSQPPLLLLDVRKVFPVTFPRSPPLSLRAEQVVLPPALKISFLRRV